MPLLPAGALAGGRSIAPMGSKRISWFLSPRARPHREPGPVGDQTGRHADQRPLGGANGASLPPLRGSVGAAGRQDASSLSAGPALERGIGKVHFGGVESVCEISPISSASSQDSLRPPHSPQSPVGHADSSSPFFGGCLKTALAGDRSRLRDQGCAASPRVLSI
ncbi:unnamed protein product [Prorocentrum cordatum]|uniref:Uncharacterized protein n=1 Tax=Prorocentrum cordatum TaxID=2364126 RepID=A0ABN9Y057_9DINO|nr:unnamed protein product [Polarella glacialis]